MDIRTSENCQKYREAKRFIKEYEEEYNSILYNMYDIDNHIYIIRQKIVILTQRIKDYPNFTHIKGNLERRKIELKELLIKKYKQEKNKTKLKTLL